MYFPFRVVLFDRQKLNAFPNYSVHLAPGLFNRCTKIYQFNRLETECAPFVTGLDQENNSFPNAWKASLIFYVIGVCVMSLTIIASLLGIDPCNPLNQLQDYCVP